MAVSEMKREPKGRLIYAASETDADILYPTGFFAPDPFLFIQKGRTRILVMSDLEMDGRRAPAADVIAQALRQLGLRRVTVPQSFPLGLAQELGRRGIRLDLG